MISPFRFRRFKPDSLVGLLALCGFFLLLTTHADAAEGSVDELLNQARIAFTNGNHAEALTLATKAIEAAPKNAQGYFARGKIHELDRQHEKAIADYDQVLKLDARAAEVYQLRGSEHFKLGHINESIADFDKYLELAPAQRPYHWQRGISLYYAGRFEDGRKQFELHQTVNSSDVENAVWHYLCVARSVGVEKARASLIAIKGDGRVPMMQVHALFGGRTKPEDVLAAGRAGDPSPATLQRQLFYAHLYLGLYYEAAGDEKLARDYIYKAAEQSNENGYMGDVARVHADLLRRAEKKKSSPDDSVKEK